MSYQGVGGQQGGYGQYNPYAEQEQYGDTQGGYGNQGPYSTRPEPQHHGSSRYDDEEQGAGRYEMTNMNGSNSNDPNRILNECRAVDRAVDDIENDLAQIKSLQAAVLNDTDVSGSSPLTRELDSLNETTMSQIRALIQRVRNIKQNPESGSPRNAAQVGKVDRRLKTTLNQYQQINRDHQKKVKEQYARSYRIARPDASDAEVQEAAENSSNRQVFSDFLMNSDRRGVAQSTLESVRGRHEQLQKIERDMVIVAQLFQDLEAVVVQHEPAVAQVEQKAEEVNDQVGLANNELDVAVKKAKAARRKKWMCVGIVLLIIIVIIVVVVVVVEVTKNH